MRLTFFYCFFLFQLITSCEVKSKQQVVEERFQFVKDSVPALELTAKPLKSENSNTKSYELSILNHSSRARIFWFLGSMSAGIRCEGGSMVGDERGIVCNAMMSFCKTILAHGCLKYQVELSKESIRNPRFSWELTEVESISDRPVIVDTMRLVTQ